jgi:membrane protein implicated in regulation of membrane protease activity
MFLDLNQVELLVLVGMLTIVIEMFFMPGLGFLFFGMACLTTAGIIYYFPSLIYYQYIFVAILACIWFLLLWKPLKHYMHKKKESEHIFDIINSKVKVIDSDILPGTIGKIEWSGTIMNAKLKDGIEEKAKIGSFWKVIAVKGNVVVLG